MVTQSIKKNFGDTEFPCGASSALDANPADAHSRIS
jgi:hypothetical protein